MEQDIKELLELIKNSKKYRNISEEIIEQQIKEYIRRNPRFQEHKQKFILKEIKARLHKIHGVFRGKLWVDENLLAKKDYKGILKTNASTKDRINCYDKLYKKIFELTGNPRTIVDLGSGLNPLSIVYYPKNPNPIIEYYSYDINEKEKEIINHFFKNEKINGNAQIIDLSKPENVELLPKADVCLMFKFIDTIEAGKKGHKYAEQIIKPLTEKCKFLVVSFATKTITGKAMNHPYRGWIERMLERVSLDFKVLDFSHDCGEIFYIISKKD